MSATKQVLTDAAFAAVPLWYHGFEVTPGVRTPGLNPCERILEELKLPFDLSNKRVLDVGTRDGFYAFTCERRGAEVTAIDIQPPRKVGFNTIKELWRCKTEYRELSVYDIQYANIEFDVILFLGTIYHLRHPLLALEKLRAVCKDGAQLYVESFVTRDYSPKPIARFLPRAELCNDPTNWWAFNVSCLVELIEAAGFTVRRFYPLPSDFSREIVHAIVQ